MRNGYLAALEEARGLGCDAMQIFPYRRHAAPSPGDISAMAAVQYLLIEGGAEAAAAFLKDDLVDRLLIYRAPIVIGSGKPGVATIGLTDLAAAHGRWKPADCRRLGNDTLEVYERTLCSPA